MIFLGAAFGLFRGIGLIFLLLIGCGILNISLEGDGLFLDILKIFFSWTPTIAVLINLKKLYSDTDIKGFFKKMFEQPVKWKVILFIIVIEILLNVLAGLFVAVYEKESFSAQWAFSVPIILNAAVMSLVTGACGEESGWRGFLLPHFMERRGCIQSGILVGIIWGFWHLPLWLISGYTGIGLLFYSVQFMICVIDWSVIMGILYSYNHNLAVPMLFHLLVNFLLCFFVGNDLLYQATCAVLYTAGAVIYTKKKKNLSQARISI